MKDGYLRRTIRETFPNLKDVPSTDSRLRRGIVVTRRALLLKGVKSKTGDEYDDADGSREEKFRAPGAGRKSDFRGLTGTF